MALTNILECENNFTSTFIAEGLEVGKHFYWEINGYTLHGQVFIISWLVIFLLILFSFLGTNNLTEVPRSWQNFMEFLVEYIESIAKKPNW
jgi:F-type H+-transporting ATPase subunit a